MSTDSAREHFVDSGGQFDLLVLCLPNLVLLRFTQLYRVERELERSDVSAGMAELRPPRIARPLESAGLKPGNFSRVMRAKVLRSKCLIMESRLPNARTNRER